MIELVKLTRNIVFVIHLTYGCHNALRSTNKSEISNNDWAFSSHKSTTISPSKLMYVNDIAFRYRFSNARKRGTLVPTYVKQPSGLEANR
ncbi:hypothetical protein J6590_007856 [Homalodisca vitripennis]|nr:hypothetical protein J6590_007856 [Homalodisca vitripennis]